MSEHNVLARIHTDTDGMSAEDTARYLAQHVGIGIAFMRGACGEKFTQEFVTAALTAVAAYGADAFVSPDGRSRVVLPRDPSEN